MIEKDSPGMGAGSGGLPESGRRLRYLAGAVFALLIAVIVLIAGVSIVADKVDGHSMMPTLRNHERFLVTPGTGGKANRFDVVVMHGGRSANALVKRVIALPGDKLTIESTDDSYRVLVQPSGQSSWYEVRNNAWTGQDRRPVQCCDADGRATSIAKVQTVPAGKFFVLGDNPDESTDSRTFGWADLAKITGRVGLRVWPLSAWGDIGNRPTLVEVPAPTP